ncbi:MAG: hypothetical protein OXC91_15040 [Rhodobacteraceae bacterium]|nr:hypothetical protein [Paracoccaceae bacterium]MDD9812835.1 hypothetical protein [Nitrososphaerota archaeon]
MIIEPRAVNLGYILKMVPHAPDGMATFDDRLRLQKLVYMIEAFDVYLGYDFSWYLRGPYCTRLAKTGFELEQIADRIEDDPKTKFADPYTQKRFEKAIQFIDRIMKCPSDTERLEIAASIHLLLQTTSLDKQAIFSRVISKMPPSGDQKHMESLCESMWDELSKEDLIPYGR